MSGDSSDDDMPLSQSNGHGAKDQAMDNGDVNAGLSIRHGPVEDESMDVDPLPNGSSKRKSRTSIGKAVNYKDESDSDGEPLAKRQKSKHKEDSDDEPISKSRRAKLPPSVNETAMMDLSSDDDQPLGQKVAKKKASIEKAAAKEAKAIRAAETKTKKATPSKAVKNDESDDEPLAKPKKRQSSGTASKAASAKRTNGIKKEESDSDDAPISKKVKKAAPKSKSATPAKAAPKKKAQVKSEDDDESNEEDEHRWWEIQKEDDSIKWTTLEHNGVLFPPPYEPLPKIVKLHYDGKPVDLHHDAEEVATFFGSMMHSKQNVDNPVFQKNFFNDFQDIVKKTGGAKDSAGNKVAIKEFKKLNFDDIFAHYQRLSEAKKAMSKEEKKAAKAEKDQAEAPYMYCMWDGRKEKVGNFRVEPPGLFRGRGEHPKTGTVKKRVMPEQVTINIGKDARVPPPPEGHQWKEVKHDNKGTWLATWQENVNGNFKYVMLAANSAVKGQADLKKFEKARELKKHIDKIRGDYERELKSELMADRQRATAMYLIDKFALRAGNEKDTENEAETVGCCSLKCGHVTLEEREGQNIVIFDFLGKDSIRFYNEFAVERQVFKNLKMFKKAPKTDTDDIFDRLTTTQLNKHLQSYMTGLTAKVFRTYNASYTMSNLLKNVKVKPGTTMAEKVKLYNDCNREVAILCNHKRTVGAAHQAQMEKLGEKIKGLRYQKWRTKMMILDVDPKQKKKKGAEFFALDADLDDQWVQAHIQSLAAERRDKIEKKFQKDNEKLVAEGDKPLPDKELKERLKEATELEAKLKKEYKTKKVEADGRAPTVEKLMTQLDNLDKRISTTEAQSADREGNKEVALGTSKINYIDPRLTVVFANKVGAPLEKFFSKTLREKFNWAIQSVGDKTDWEF